jgi:spore maturation protein CgeB
MSKLLYVAGSFAGSTTLDRRAGLIASGWDIFHLSTDPWVRHPSRLWRGLHFRLNYGPLITQLNRSVRVAAVREKPKVVWIDKGTWIWPETVLFLKSLDMMVVHFTPDSIRFPFHSTRSFLRSVPRYDLIITTKEWEVNDYERLGAKRVFLTRQGSSPSRTRPMTNPEPRFSSDLVFIGRAEPHYVETIRRIAHLLPKIDLKVWGNWVKAAREHPDILRLWQGGGVYGDDYARAISGAKIGVGLLSRIIPETDTTRSFEIPACKTMLLAERTEAHKHLYKEGVEAEFFESPEEAATKILYYLDRPDDRERIACSGYRRYIESEYTTERFMKDCTSEVMSILEGR